MKYMQRANIYQCSNYNCTFNPKTLDAFSYKWWRFVAKVDGKLVFNNYYYSPTTAKHQSKVRGLLSSLGIKIAVSLPIRKGLDGRSLNEFILEAEEYLCDQYSIKLVKAQERYQANKGRRAYNNLEAKLSTYLENEVHFRDYKIMPKSQFGKLNEVAVHQVVDADTLENDVQNALYNFHRDGFGSVVFYVGGL